MRIQNVNSSQKQYNKQQNFKGFRLTVGLPSEIRELAEYIPLKYKSVLPIDRIIKGEKIPHIALIATGEDDVHALNVADTYFSEFDFQGTVYTLGLKGMLGSKVDFKQVPQPAKEMLTEMKNPRYNFEQIRLDAQA